jgi:hypothetical protein
MSEWIELPCIGPEHIKAARMIKHIVTGNLDAHINSFPEFKGKEKHFLKAQLVRMMHNCEIVPTGMYKAVDDKRRFELNQLVKLKLILNTIYLKLRRSWAKLRIGFTTILSFSRLAELPTIFPRTSTKTRLTSSGLVWRRRTRRLID